MAPSGHMTPHGGEGPEITEGADDSHHQQQQQQQQQQRQR